MVAARFPAAKHKELVAKSWGRLCRGIIICVASRAAQKALSPKCGFYFGTCNGSAAREDWYFIRRALPHAKKVPLLFNRQFGRDREVVGRVFCAFCARGAEVGGFVADYAVVQNSDSVRD